MELTKKQMNILDFTLYHATNGLYCCSFDDPDMKFLIANGLMTKVARASFVPSQEGYFGITAKGSRTIRQAQEQSEAQSAFATDDSATAASLQGKAF